jgi:hypothetical protein
MGCSARVSLAVLVCFAHFAARVGIVVLVFPGLIDRLEVPGAIAVRAGSAVPVWWSELAGLVECWVGLAKGEFRSAGLRAWWLKKGA